MKTFLLIGAGFSRNWGGLLASEFFDHLLEYPEVRNNYLISETLVKHRANNTGFEGALAELSRPNLKRFFEEGEDRQTLQSAVLSVFRTMEEEWSTAGFSLNFNNEVNYSVETFLSRFDCIFSLNQDLLLEHSYLAQMPAIFSTQRLTGFEYPCMEMATHDRTKRWLNTWVPCSTVHWKPTENIQPIFKLHGSSNWRTEDGGNLLILGADKSANIASNALLQYYLERFETFMSEPEPKKLVVVGYSFNDEHINRAIEHGVEKQNLELYLIDPAGYQVLENIKNGPVERRSLADAVRACPATC